jgi:opacity protein-like surface antigen
MKKITSAIFSMLVFVGLSGQAFEQGRSYISLGYGFGNLTQAVIKAAVAENDLKYSSFGPAFLKYEYGIAEKIGIGVNVAYLNAKVSASDSYIDDNNNTVNFTETLKYSTTSILGRVNFHFGDNDNIDPYLGVGMGYRTAKYTYTSSDPEAPQDEELKSLSPFGMEITFGTRFLFTDNIGAYVEVGMAKAVFQIGLSVKL